MGKLFSYKLTRDTGFAPCPFGGFISLGTCKPMIRQYKDIDDWIAGFTSIELDNKYRDNIRMIFLMKIERKVTFAEYWNSKEFSIKKPNKYSVNIIERVGDNYYKPVVKNPLSHRDYKQIPNLHHDSSNQKKDISGIYVLLSKEFYYFGQSPILVPYNIHPDVPKYQAGHGVETKDIKRKQAFFDYMETNYKIGIYDRPHGWGKMFGDNDTWRLDENYIES